MQMINSMTGFGRCELVEGTRKFTVEVKSVNHRYLDVNIKMPKKLNFFESSIRNELKNFMQRGKVDIYIAYEDCAETTGCVKYNKKIAEEYVNYLGQMAERYPYLHPFPLSRCVYLRGCGGGRGRNLERAGQSLKERPAGPGGDPY